MTVPHIPDPPRIVRRLSTIEEPERTASIAESTAWWLHGEAMEGSKRLYRWKYGTTEILFGDGSMRRLFRVIGSIHLKIRPGGAFPFPPILRL